jgi:hypothetical protein
MPQTHMELKTSSIIDQAHIDLCQNHITNACIPLFVTKTTISKNLVFLSITSHDVLRRVQVIYFTFKTANTSLKNVVELKYL